MALNAKTMTNKELFYGHKACPGCGATNPGRKMSRQQHDLIVLLIQLIIGTALVVAAGSWVWNTVGPIVKQQMSKPVNG